MTGGWRDTVLKHFFPGIGPVTVVSDQDGLLRDPGIYRAIEDRGFALVQFESSISFRFDYEGRYRPRWEAGECLELVVVFKPGEREFETLPADILSGANRLSFTLKDIFAKMSYGVISRLETIYYDALFRAQEAYGATALGDAMTCDFILQHVFHIVPSIVTRDSDLLRLLCEKHYRKSVLPEVLDEHLVATLARRSDFKIWPLDRLIRDRASFWEFLDERWPIFVRQTRGGKSVIRDEPEALKYPGPRLLPFEHDDVRVFIDNLFEDGILTPLEWSWEDAIPETWIRVGLAGAGTENVELRFTELLEHLANDCPDGDDDAHAWSRFAQRYAQLRLLWTEIGAQSRAQRAKEFSDFTHHVNGLFRVWLNTGYPSIFNYPVVTPLMVHHVAGYIGHCLKKGTVSKAALIVFDGLALEQWVVLKEQLAKAGLKRKFDDGALFAWVPTITPISRQAIYSGQPPKYFAESIDRTDRDNARWKQFWGERGYQLSEIEFHSLQGNVGEESFLEDIDLGRVKVLGITVMKTDKIMHGMQLGAVGMNGQIRTWVEEGFILSLVEHLLIAGFDIFVTADHGNTEAKGVGVPNEGVLAETRGQRCRVYSEDVLRAKALQEIPESSAWHHSGLPSDLHVLLAPESGAFVHKGARIVCHGGASVEEVIVPFAHIAAN